MKNRLAASVVAVVALAGCGSPDGPAAQTDSSPTITPSASAASSSDGRFPDVIKAELTKSGDGFSVAVTMSSPYDSPERYADGWRVMTADNTVLNEHTLTHDHANEQPFTRTSATFTIPDDVTQVVVQGHDQHNGYGGTTVTITVPR